MTVASSILQALQTHGRPTLSSIAAECGVSTATVSRALSDHPNVRLDLRTRIRQVADRHGYTRNQLVSNLMAYVRQDRTKPFVGNLAIVHIPSDKQPHLLPMQQSIIDGANHRAADLGFSLGVFRLGDAETGSPESLGRILRARGMLGVIFLHPNSNEATKGFPWHHFASVHIDFQTTAPLHDTVALDHYSTLTSALHRLRHLGHRRFGLFIARHKDERLIHRWSAAFRSFQENQAGIGDVPVLLKDTINRRELLDWFRRYKPDLIIGHVDQAVEWLKAEGAAIPDKVAYFNLNWNERSLPCAGLDLRPELHGIVAVETLAAKIHRNEQGMPTDPRTIMFSGSWVDGPTLPVKSLAC